MLDESLSTSVLSDEPLTFHIFENGSKRGGRLLVSSDGLGVPGQVTGNINPQISFTGNSFQDLTMKTVICICNERPSKATANPVGGKACSPTKGGLLRYIPNTYSNHKVSSF